MVQSPTHHMDEAPEQQDPAHTNNATSNKEKHRPKSRASTTSLQSVGVGSAFQPPQQQQTPPAPPPADDSTMPLDQNGYYVQHGPHPAAAMYGPNPDEILMHYHNIGPHLPQQSMDPSAAMPQHEMRPMSQQAFHEMQSFPMQYPHGLPPYPVGPQHMHHMRHHSEQFEGSPAPEDSNTENGAKRRKGTSSSVANDQELRRLLAQYQGKTLKEVAAEVQKNEGSGGKSEKAKQVFAMLWCVSLASLVSKLMDTGFRKAASDPQIQFAEIVSLLDIRNVAEMSVFQPSTQHRSANLCASFSPMYKPEDWVCAANPNTIMLICR